MSTSLKNLQHTTTDVKASKIAVNCGNAKEMSRVFFSPYTLSIPNKKMSIYCIAVGSGGGGWGAVAPPFGSKRRKFRQIVFLFGHTSGEKPSQFQWRPFFFGEHLNLDRKTVSISVKTFFWRTPLNLDRKTDWFFVQNSMHQVIFRAKVWCPPNHFELLRPWSIVNKQIDINFYLL